MAKLITFFVLIATTVFGFNDGDTLRPPAYGDATCTVLTPTVIELCYVTQFYPAADGIWNYSGGTPAPSQFVVTANGKAIPAGQVSYKRKPLFGYHCDGNNRGQPYGCIGNYLYLSLNQPIPDGAVVAVSNPDQSVLSAYGSALQFAATNLSTRTSPVIHVNQTGYVVGQRKKAIIGYYCGTTLNELPVSSSLGFSLVNDATGAKVFSGQLTARPDDPSANGFATYPKYQMVLEANFSAFDTPGLYRVSIPGLGVSLPFSIDAGVASFYARTFGLGMYHTRCGGVNAMPYTRFTKDACHTADVAIPPVNGGGGQADYSGIRTEDGDNINAANNPPSGSYGGQSGYTYANVLAGKTKSMSGGHHDAGDYGRYMHNSSMVAENLLFAVDVIDGVANIDNIGLPESGDHIPDLLQEAKWELDYIVNCQDSDGGVFCQINASDDRDWPFKAHPFEGSQSLTHGYDGSSQVAFPKTRPVTADAVGALALAASSPAMKRHYPAAATAYWKAAQAGWAWLQNHTVVEYTDHYGAWNGLNSADMQMAFASAAMFAATGDSQYQDVLKQYCPAPGNTRKWTWIPACDQWGCAFRTYVFAAKAGRKTTGQDDSYKTACKQELIAAADMIVNDVGLSAYGADINNAYKRPRNAGWQTLTDTLLDCAAGFQLNPKQSYIDATLSALDYAMGCNPNNMTFITGCGRKRQQNTVCQYHENDGVWQDVRKMPPTGTPTGAWWAGFYADTWWYNHRNGNDSPNRVTDNCVFPKAGSLGDGGVYPMYDIWWDAFNTGEEYVIQQLSDVYAASAWLQAYFGQTNTAWKGKALSINVHSTPSGQPVTFTPSVSGVPLTKATIVWETGPQQTGGSLARTPSTLWQGGTLTYTPTNSGPQWLEVEASLPDGRRLFAVTNFNVTGDGSSSSPIVSNPTPTDGGTTPTTPTSTNAPGSGPALMTNGYGKITHGPWPASMAAGKKYAVTATPNARNLFVNWTGGTTEPYSVLSTSASCAFTNQPNLVLMANFMTNVFSAAQGTYRGLFAPQGSDRQQTNSGSFWLNITAGRNASGSLNLGGQTVYLSGKFGLDGTLTNVSKRPLGAASLTTTLQLDSTNQSITGTVSDGSFTAQLSGNRDVFTGSQPAADFKGKYTLIIPGTNDPAIGPFGTSWGTVTVSPSGGITFGGYLADGTSVSQSSVISKDGFWPFYVSLYGGKGSLWSWNCFTNGAIIALPGASWINATNTAKSALYRAGFTNQEVSIMGSPYNPASQPLLGFSDGQVLIEGGNVSTISNQFTVTPKNLIAFTNAPNTNKLSLTINKTTGVITGGFANPSSPKQTIKLNGVLLQNQTNAAGYFLGTNQSGVFNIDPL